MRVSRLQLFLVFAVIGFVILSHRAALHDGTLRMALTPHPVQHCYSIWLRLPRQHEELLAGHVGALATKFQGTLHTPHVTLCGPIYTLDEASVVRTGQELAQRLGPLVMDSPQVRGSTFRPDKRWRSHISLRYRTTYSFRNATALCTAMYANASYTDSAKVDNPQKEPHTSILYDYTGRSTEVFSQLDVAQPDYFRDFNFTGTEISVVYTPLRDWFTSVQDMHKMVGNWRAVATFPLGN